MSENHDLVVVGAGPGGYVAALRAAQLGMKVACIDRRAVPGGTCLNVGCIPSKALLDSSEHFAFSRTRLEAHGVRTGEVSLDLGAMLARKDKVVKGLTDGVAYLFRKNRVTFVQGSARLGEPGMVIVEIPGGKKRTLKAKHIVLATGSESADLSQLPFDGTAIVNSTEALAFGQVPSHLIVVGAGYIGLELGSVWARLGAQVTVAEFLPRILPAADREAAGVVYKALSRQGLTFSLGTEVTGGSVKKGAVIVKARREDEEVTFEGDRVLVAIGRRPHTAGLGLEEAGVAMDRSGRVPVDEGFQTNVPGIHAIGDLIDGPMLAHKAEEEGVAVAERLAGGKTRVNHATIPSVVYTDPELASVGWTEEQAREAGRECRIGRFPFQANGRARCLGETEGLVKVIADARTDRVLGVHIVGPRASELIAEAVSVLEFSGSAEDVARTCHAHPTLSEAVREAALAVAGRALHA